MPFSSDCEDFNPRRVRLAEAVRKLADAMVAGECEPTTIELQALAQLCEEQFLPREAARVRRWLPT